MYALDPAWLIMASDLWYVSLRRYSSVPCIIDLYLTRCSYEDARQLLGLQAPALYPSPQQQGLYQQLISSHEKNLMRAHDELIESRELVDVAAGSVQRCDVARRLLHEFEEEEYVCNGSSCDYAYCNAQPAVSWC